MNDRSFNLENWTPPHPVPLRNTRPSAGGLVPYQVFGFPILTEDLEAWANRLNVDPNLGKLTRQEHAWRILRRSVPAEYKCHSKAVRFPRTSAATCIIIGSNNTPEDLARTQDITLIKNVHKAIRTREPPDWFYILGR